MTPAETRRVRRLAATLLCELGRAHDPRFDGAGLDVLDGDLARHFDPLSSAGRRHKMRRARPLTDAEVDQVLAHYFASSPSPRK